MSRVCGIYKITSPKKKIYIGKSINIKYRFWRYKKLYCKKQRKLYNSLVKYGPENHQFEIIQICLPEELDRLEKYYVDLYQSFSGEHGLNLRDGGDYLRNVADETRKRISDFHKGKQYTKGWIPSDKTKLLWSNQRKGKPQNPKSIEKRSKTNTGKKLILSNSCILKKRLQMIEFNGIKNQNKIKKIYTRGPYKKKDCPDRVKIQTI